MAVKKNTGKRTDAYRCGVLDRSQIHEASISGRPVYTISGFPGITGTFSCWFHYFPGKYKIQYKNNVQAEVKNKYRHKETFPSLMPVALCLLIPMELHKKILEYALSSFLRRKGKNIAIITVFTIIVAMLASILFLTHSIKKEALYILSDAPELIVQKISGGRHDLIPLEYISTIREMPGVENITPRYWGYYYDAVTEGNYTIIGINEKPDNIHFLKGKLPVKAGECALGSGIMELKNAKTGDEILFFDSKMEVISLEITGTFESRSAILTNDLIITRKEDSLRILGIPPDKATDLVVSVYNESEVPAIAKKIVYNLTGARPVMKSEIAATYESLFNWRSGMVLTVFMGALIAFCILAWDKATGLSAEERREIGILKAVGWETSHIMKLKFWEGVIISLTSFLSGLIVAYIHVFFMQAGLLAPALKGWSVLFPSFNLTPSISLYQIFTMFFLTVFPYIASTLIPSWKAAITDPDIIMRGS